jgi:hypothetical protein
MTLRPIASAIRALAIPAAIALASIPATATAGNLVTNGSFEADVLANWEWVQLPSLTGWIGGANGIELRNSVIGPAQDGLQFVELDVKQNSTMYQMINTVAGQTYNLSFWYAPRTLVTSDSNIIDVSWGGNQLNLNPITGNGGTSKDDPLVWSLYSFSVMGTGSAVELRFSAGGASDSVGGSLDNISVTAVPEPETYAMLLAGLGMMGAMVRRRRT